MVPDAVRRKAGLRGGDEIEFKVSGGVINIIPKAPVGDDRSASRGFRVKRAVDPDDALTPAEAKIVRRGEAQLKRGESKPWRVVKHALPR